MSSISEKIIVAQHLKDTGQFERAELTCREALRLRPQEPSALHLLGVVLHLRGQQQAAISYLQQAANADPKNSSYLVTLGGNLAIAGRMDEATSCFQQAVEVNPGSIEAWHNLGLAYKHLNKFADSEKCFIAAIERSLGYVDAIANLGFVVLNQGRVAEAKIVLCNALTLSPTHPLALTTLAKIMADEGRFSDAETLLAASGPQRSEISLFRLAQVYEQFSVNALTISSLRHLVAEYPKSAEAHAALATGLIGDFQMAEGMIVAKTAISLDANCASAWCSLGMASLHSGLYQEAYDALSRTIEIRPVIGPRVMRDLMLPCIMGTNAEVQKSREVFERNLDRLVDENLVSNDPLNEIGFTYFYLAYHGQNDVSLQTKIARFYEKTAPSIKFVAPHCRQSAPLKRASKIKVGFYSHFVSTHSVSFSFAKILEALGATNEFDVFLITDAPLSADGVAEVYPSLRGRARQVPRKLDAAQAAVASLELDILVYLDIGMDPLAFLLAFSRLAPVQCVMGGHPVTTGIPAIDYFFSAQPVEVPEAQNHYSEELVLLEHGAFIFQRMEMPTSLKSRAELGMPENPRLYLCPMTLQKIHPDFDEAVEAILRRDSDGAVIFFESAQSPDWARLLAKRFDRTIASSVRGRIVFMPWIKDQQVLLSIIARSDVVLDPFHFGIGTTGMHVFSVGTPIVTRPSQFARGRVGYLYCNWLQIQECIASDVDSYARIAVSIANDPELREQLKRKILKYNYRIFENAEAAPEFARKLAQLAATHS